MNVTFAPTGPVTEAVPVRWHLRAAKQGLVEQIEAVPGDDPGFGGWSGGFANQAHWDPSRPREWKCWAQSGPTWSAHCGAEVAANDTLGLCQRHRRSLLEPDAERAAPAAERLLSAS
jgi:hypothetical protein